MSSPAYLVSIKLKRCIPLFLLGLSLTSPMRLCSAGESEPGLECRTGNPLFEGWYADPEVAIFGMNSGSFPPIRMI